MVKHLDPQRAEALNWAVRALIAMCGADIFLIVIALTIDADFTDKVPTLMVYGLIAVFLSAVAWALNRGHRWARAAAMVWFGTWFAACLFTVVACIIGVVLSGRSNRSSVGVEGELIILAFAVSVLGSIVGIALWKLIGARDLAKSTNDTV